MAEVPRFIRQHRPDVWPECDNAIQLDRFSRELPCAKCRGGCDSFVVMDPLPRVPTLFPASFDPDARATTTIYLRNYVGHSDGIVNYFWERAR